MGRKPWTTLVVVSLIVIACSGAASTAPPGATSTPGPSSAPDQTLAPGAAATAGPTDAPTDVPAPLALWQSAALTDVRTGESFSIASLAGRLVVIEPMAIWCSNCRAQQTAAREALASLNDPDIVYISLDVDPNEAEPALAAYANDLDFPWVFVVASRDVARSLAETFGDGVLSPPSVPSITVMADGRAEVHFGHRNAAQLEAELTALRP